MGGATKTAIKIAALFSERSQELIRRARRLLRSNADADDAVQEVMVALLTAPHAVGVIERVRAWLFGLVHDRCVDLIRREHRRREREAATSIEGLFRGADPAELVERRELCRAVAAAVDELPPPLRWVVVKNELDELSFREMSEESGVPMGTLMARKAKAFEILRAKLKGFMG
jgi:RNA polymerase sigma factor (sigma-70 family)